MTKGDFPKWVGVLGIAFEALRAPPIARLIIRWRTELQVQPFEHLGSGSGDMLSGCGIMTRCIV
jgi:hypothetical protein